MGNKIIVIKMTNFKGMWVSGLLILWLKNSYLQQHRMLYRNICVLAQVMAPHSSILAWRIPWMEDPGGLQSMGSLRVEHDWATSLALFTLMHWRRKSNPFQCSCLENPRDGEAWWAAVYGVAQSRTQLKWLSSSSSSNTGEPWGRLSKCQAPCHRRIFMTLPANSGSVKKYVVIV